MDAFSRSSSCAGQSRGWSRLTTRTIWLLVLFTALAGPIQRGWSQSGANGDGAPAPAGSQTYTPPLTIADYENYIKSHWLAHLSQFQPASLPAPPQTAAPVPVPSSPAKNLAPITPVDPLNLSYVPAYAQPPRDITFAAPSESSISAAPQGAPLSTSDPIAVSLPAPPIMTPIPAPSTAKCLDPITSVESLGAPNQSTYLHPPIDITFAAPSDLPARRAVPLASNPQPAEKPLTPTPADDTETAVANSSPQQIYDFTTEDKPLVDNDLPTADPSAVVAPPVPEPVADETPVPLASEPENYLSPSPAEQRVAVLAQAPEKQMPPPARVDSNVETAPSRTESIPTADINSPEVPMTNSSYLPANPEEYCFRCGVKCPPCGCNPGGPGWGATRPIPWEVFAQGEYVGPARLSHVPVYRLRVDDQLSFVYYLSGKVAGQPYRLNVRDRMHVQSLSAPEVVNREVLVEPDGTVTLPLLGQVRAAGATLEELSNSLNDLYKRQIKDPRITVTPLVMNSNLEELRSSVDRRYGQGGQVSTALVSPDGTIQLPAIGQVPTQGLTLDELQREIKARYAQIVEGLEVTPILTQRAPRFVYVVGEVRLPGRYAMEGPTTLMQAIALAGSWNVGAQLNEVVVFRRDENWQLMATKVNIRSSLLFKKPCPAGEIWLRDSDIVLVPKSPILCADDVIELVFTRGIYGVFPMNATLNFAKLSTL
jgi:polysaccharide biosynthesis/export protein